MLGNSTQPKKWKYTKIASFALQAIIVGLLIFYFYQNREVLNSLRNISWLQVFWIILLDTASFLLGSFLNYLMIHRLDKNISFLDCLMLQYINNLLNKILPTIGGGAAFRAYFLKKKYQFPYSQLVSTVAGIYVISFCSSSLIGIFCLLVVYTRWKVFNWLIFLAFTAILLTTLFIILFSPQIPNSNNRFIKVLKGIVEGWNIIKKDPKFIIFFTCFSIILLVLSALQTSISYQALGIIPDIIPMLYLSTLGIILAFLNFTPDGIGVKEGIYIFSSKLVQIPDEILVLGSLILRAISICTTFIIGGVCYWFLLRQLKRIDKNTAGILQDQKPL